MKSTILTKINTVIPKNFAHQIEIMKGQSDYEFLKKFVCHCHKNADTTTDGIKTITAFTNKGWYIYTAYQNHIVRTDKTDKKKYYQIS